MPRFPIRPTFALLCACLCLAACAPSATASASPTATMPPAPTATPAPDWQAYTDPRFGFKVAIPAALWVDPSMQPPQQSSTDSFVQFVYHDTGSRQTSQLASLFYLTGGVNVYASTAPTRCQLQGTSVRVGDGITGYRFDNFTQPAAAGATVPGGSVSFVTGGLYVNIFLSPSSSFLTANGEGQYWTSYGPVWQHILASFIPGPAIAGGRPCG